MKDLLEALTILAKYADAKYDYAPTHCEHDIFAVTCVRREVLNPEDAARLDALGFHWSKEYECWASFRFGSS